MFRSSFTRRRAQVAALCRKIDLRYVKAFFEYQAKITNAGHAENEGEPVHCMIKMKSVDEHGKRRRNVELEQQAGDNVLFVINHGPNKKISHSSIWSVSKETFQKAGTASDQLRVGDCEMFFYRD